MSAFFNASLRLISARRTGCPAEARRDAVCRAGRRGSCRTARSQRQGVQRFGTPGFTRL